MRWLSTPYTLSNPNQKITLECLDLLTLSVFTFTGKTTAVMLRSVNFLVYKSNNPRPYGFHKVSLRGGRVLLSSSSPQESSSWWDAAVDVKQPIKPDLGLINQGRFMSGLIGAQLHIIDHYSLLSLKIEACMAG